MVPRWPSLLVLNVANRIWESVSFSSGETYFCALNFIMNIMNDQVHFYGFNTMNIDI